MWKAIEKPSMRFSNNGSTASGVTSRPVKPVPPVVMTTSTAGVSIHSFTRARIASTSSRTIVRSNTIWPAALMRSESVAPDLSSARSRVSEMVSTANLSGTNGLLGSIPAMQHSYQFRCGGKVKGPSFFNNPVLINPVESGAKRIGTGESALAPEHIAKIVIDRVQVQRRRFDRAKLDDEAIPNHPVAEGAFGRIRAIPRKMNRLAVARAHARPLRGRKRRRQVVDHISLN